MHELSDRKAKLEAVVYEVATLNASGNRPFALLVFLVGIRNSGESPSIAEDWELGWRGGNVVPTTFNDGTTFSINGKSVFEWREKYSLAERSMSPVLPGAEVRGQLAFQLYGATEQELKSKRDLVFRDVYGKRHSADFSLVNERPGLPLYFPDAGPMFGEPNASRP